MHILKYKTIQAFKNYTEHYKSSSSQKQTFYQKYKTGASLDQELKNSTFCMFAYYEWGNC